MSFASLLALAAVFLGCSGSTTSKEVSGGFYENKDLSLSFRVPPGWKEPKSWMGGKGPYIARFDSPEGDASVIAAQAPHEGGSCAATAKAALTTASGATMSVDKEFELKSNVETLSAGMGQTSSATRRGLARFFCRSRVAMILEAAADTSAFSSRESTLASTVDSFAFTHLGEQVAIHAPVAPPEPKLFVHVVKSRGQTLGKIAEWYTGDYENWKKLPRYNIDLSVPNVPLKIGAEVKIPEELVTRRDPMPAPKRKAAGRKSPSMEKRQHEPGEAPAETKPSEEEEEAPEEEAAPLPPVIGPR